MTKGLRTTVYAAAALTLAALLVLLLMPAQARYLRAAQWQASYATSPSELTSDLLTLRDDKTQLLLADWSPTERATKPVTFNMTCPAELLQVSTVEETAETQPAEPVLVTLGAVDEHLQAAPQVSWSPNGDTGTANIAVTLTLTAQTVPESAVDVKLPIRVTIMGTDIWFGGELYFTLCPTAEGASVPEETKLFNDAASMTEYDVTQPFYVQYTLPEGCTAAQMTQAGTGFPKGTRFSTDEGVSYSVLCESRPIPVTGSQSLLVDMSGVSSWSGERTLQLTANGQDGRVFTDTLALTEKSWGGDGAVTYTEDDLPTMQIQPWNSGCLQITAAVERLARVEEPVMTEGQEDASRQQTQSTVKYVSGDDVVQIEWTPAVEGEGVATEGNSPADATETQTLMLLPAEGVSRVPAGTYRLTISWKNGNVLVAQRVIPFFVTR